MMTTIAARLPALGSVYLPMTTIPVSVTRRGFSLVELLEIKGKDGNKGKDIRILVRERMVRERTLSNMRMSFMSFS